MNKGMTLVAGAALLFVGSAFAQEAVLSGIVTKVDKPQGTVRIQYGRPSATSGASSDTSEDFKVADGRLFNAIKAGDKVRFTVEQKDGAKTVTKLEKQSR
jgi:Cu/Ag efflux protein CusF